MYFLEIHQIRMHKLYNHHKQARLFIKIGKQITYNTIHNWYQALLKHNKKLIKKSIWNQ